MNLRFLLIFLFIIALLLNASEDIDLEREILQYKDQDLEIITNSRRIIIDCLESDSLDKISEIEEYLLKNYQSKDYVALYPEEIIMIYFITGKYDLIIEEFQSEIEYFETGYFPLERKIYPPNDWLYLNLIDYVNEHKESLRETLINTDMDGFQKDFIWLLILNFLYDEDGNITVDYINNKSNLYLAKYPDSIYEGYIRNYLRYVYKLGNFGLGFEFFSGYGKFHGDMNKLFTGNVALGVAFDISYKDLTFYLRDYIGVGCKTRKSFEYKGDWKKDLKQNVYKAEISAGYPLLENNRFKLSAFGGVSAMGISPPEIEQEDEENDVRIEFSLAYDFGLNLDLKMGRCCKENNLHNFNNYWFIRLRGGYSIPDFERLDNRFSGEMIYLNIGFGAYGRPLARDF